ncbi:glutamate dehydrogenase, partial [Ornithobacterium rhinotracheale]
KRDEIWKIEKVLQQMKDKVETAFDKEVDAKEHYYTVYIRAAYIVSLERIAEVYIERCLFT